MKRKSIFAIVLAFMVCFMFTLVGCNNVENTDNNTPTIEHEGKKILIAYFSRTGENYGVGYIEKGNTAIIAEMIQDEIGGDLFHIQRAAAYPEVYSDCTAEAQAEKNNNARPALKETKSVEEYDIIYLGYPIWWSDMPMPVYTFLESNDFTGKVVYPFCTHAGSRLSGTVTTLRNKLTDATVMDGLAISGTTAQNNQSSARSSVLDWLGK